MSLLLNPTNVTFLFLCKQKNFHVPWPYSCFSFNLFCMHAHECEHKSSRINGALSEFFLSHVTFHGMGVLNTPAVWEVFQGVQAT